MLRLAIPNGALSSSSLMSFLSELHGNGYGLLVICNLQFTKQVEIVGHSVRTKVCLKENARA